MTDETIELLSCPFCSGEAMIEQAAPPDEEIVWVRCKDCSIGKVIHHGGKLRAIEMWNRRHTDAAPVASATIHYCRECDCDVEILADDTGWGHPCPTIPSGRCESYLEPTVSAPADTTAAPGGADDYPGTPLARLDEAVLGRELIAHAAMHYAEIEYPPELDFGTTTCWYCRKTWVGNDEERHADDCLHLRARALRGESE